MKEKDNGGLYGSAEHHARGGRRGKSKNFGKESQAVPTDKQTFAGTLQGGTGRPRPKTSGGIVRQLILQTENQLAQKKSDIEFLESQLEQFREMLSEWQAGVSGIETDQDAK